MDVSAAAAAAAVEDDTNLHELLAAIHIDDERNAPPAPSVPPLSTRTPKPRRVVLCRARCPRPPRPKFSTSPSSPSNPAPPPSPTTHSPPTRPTSEPSPLKSTSRDSAPYRVTRLPAHPVILRSAPLRSAAMRPTSMRLAAVRLALAADTMRSDAMSSVDMPSATTPSAAIRAAAINAPSLTTRTARFVPFRLSPRLTTTRTATPLSNPSFEIDTASLSSFTAHAFNVVSFLLEKHPAPRLLYSRFSQHITQLRNQWNARLISKSLFLHSVNQFVRKHFDNGQDIDLVKSFKFAQRERYKRSLSRMNTLLADLSRAIDYQDLHKRIKQPPPSAPNNQKSTNLNNTNDQPSSSSSAQLKLTSQHLVLPCFWLRACMKLAQLAETNILSLRAAERIRNHIITSVRQYRALKTCHCQFFNELRSFLHNDVPPSCARFYQAFALWFEQEQRTFTELPGSTTSTTNSHTSCDHCRKSDSDQMSDVAVVAVAAAASDAQTRAHRTDLTMGTQPESEAKTP